MSYSLFIEVLFGLGVLLLAMIIFSYTYPFYYRLANNLSLSGIFTTRSFSITDLIALAQKNTDMTEHFKSFYDMKYQHAIFIIKGIGGVIVLFITTFVEKIVADEKRLTQTDIQLVVITGFLVLILIFLASQLRNITVEYGETLRIYHIHRP